MSNKNDDPDEAIELLRSLALWLDGMSKFIAISKSNWTHANTGNVLLAQRLSQHTLTLKHRVEKLVSKSDAPSSIQHDPTPREDNKS